MYGVEQPLFKLFSEGGKPREEAQVPRQPGAVSEVQGSLEAMPLLAFPPLGVSLSFSNWSMGRHALPLENRREVVHHHADSHLLRTTKCRDETPAPPGHPCPRPQHGQTEEESGRQEAKAEGRGPTPPGPYPEDRQVRGQWAAARDLECDPTWLIQCSRIPKALIPPRGQAGVEPSPAAASHGPPKVHVLHREGSVAQPKRKQLAESRQTG